jgi:uncharacterized Zn finger protein
MLEATDLADLTDPGSLGRGRAYARQGRVEALERRPDELRALVVGSEPYHVRIGHDSWWCDCPVGTTGAFCKHCVAVVIAADEESAEVFESSPGDENHPADAWLAGLDADELRDLLREAAAQIPEVADLVHRAYIASSDDLTALRREVEDALTPRRRFYEYGQANRYAREADPLLHLLVERARRPSEELLEVVERALALTVRTILRSDDSSGAQGDQVARLLDLHADVAAGLGHTLMPKQRRRLARWLHRFVFSGQQDFFEIDVDRYADALGAEGVAEYRRLVDKSAEASGEDVFAVRYARGRLAVLDRDPAQIVAVIGQGLRTQYDALRVVEALDEAGLHELAVQHAEDGLELAQSPHATALVQRLVDNATAHGDRDRVLVLRREAFRRDPSARTLALYRDSAQATGSWAAEARKAEQRLADARPWEMISVLLSAGRDEEAWAFAMAHPDVVGSQWETLCARRARTAPAETVPHYERMVAETLATTGRDSYRAAARLLVRLRAACAEAGTPGEFADFMAATVEANRRRPTCMDEFVRAGLMRTDRTVVGV